MLRRFFETRGQRYIHVVLWMYMRAGYLCSGMYVSYVYVDKVIGVGCIVVTCAED